MHVRTVFHNNLIFIFSYNILHLLVYSMWHSHESWTGKDVYLIHFSMPIARSIWQTVAVHGASVVILYCFPNPTSGSARSSVIIVCVCAHAQSLSCVRFFCNPMDYSPPGSSVQGIFRQEYWLVAISSSRNWTCVSCSSWIGMWILYPCTTWEASRLLNRLHFHFLHWLQPPALFLMLHLILADRWSQSLLKTHRLQFLEQRPTRFAEVRSRYGFFGVLEKEQLSE